MMLTPRQIAAYLEFNAELQRIEQANALAIAALGAQGDEKVIRQQVKELSGT